MEIYIEGISIYKNNYLYRIKLLMQHTWSEQFYFKLEYFNMVGCVDWITFGPAPMDT